ncbi:MAG: Na+/H+ antiporter NhaA [Candidatus Synoicihabitans palmerolidicus]|nr:Na+/H+ antiporter NhaA [Candidatus Synoicihabitans palmerolidicus]
MAMDLPAPRSERTGIIERVWAGAHARDARGARRTLVAESAGAAPGRAIYLQRNDQRRAPAGLRGRRSGWANSPWSPSYFALRDTSVSLRIGAFSLALDLQHWSNDGLMAVFFFVVALEIKRELVDGDLSDARTAALPVAAALGGMMLPAGIYFAVNFGGTGAAGWGIPMATDIAFAVAILALLGNRVPASRRLFLLTLAIADDVGLIVVIAVYYTAHFSLPAMGVAVAVLGLMLAMRWLGFRSTLAYLFPAVLFWAAMLKSGVHATIAGVILGAITPAR